MSPANIIRSAKLRDLSFISVTDHESMEIYENEFSDSRRTQIAEEEGIVVVPGMEVNTNAGDVIGLFLDREIQSRRFEEVVDEIRQQQGLVVLPHPYHRSVEPKELVGKVDLIEAVNGRCRQEMNHQARQLAEETGTPILGGSDAHMYWEMGKVSTEFPHIDAPLYDISKIRTALLEHERQIKGSPWPYLLTHGVSFVSGRVKGLRGWS